MLNINQENCIYQLVKPFGLAQQGNQTQVNQLWGKRSNQLEHGYIVYMLWIFWAKLFNCLYQIRLFLPNFADFFVQILQLSLKVRTKMA